MQIVIDILKDDYEFIVNEVDTGYCDDVRQINNRLYHYIAKGIVIKQKGEREFTEKW